MHGQGTCDAEQIKIIQDSGKFHLVQFEADDTEIMIGAMRQAYLGAWAT